MSEVNEQPPAADAPVAKAKTKDPVTLDLVELANLYKRYITLKADTEKAIGDDAARLKVEKHGVVVAIGAIKSKYGLP